MLENIHANITDLSFIKAKGETFDLFLRGTVLHVRT